MTTVCYTRKKNKRLCIVLHNNYDIIKVYCSEFSFKTRLAISIEYCEVAVSMTAKFVLGMIVMCYRFSNMRYDTEYT